MRNWDSSLRSEWHCFCHPEQCEGSRCNLDFALRFFGNAQNDNHTFWQPLRQNFVLPPPLTQGRQGEDQICNLQCWQPLRLRSAQNDIVGVGGFRRPHICRLLSVICRLNCHSKRCRRISNYALRITHYEFRKDRLWNEAQGYFSEVFIFPLWWHFVWYLEFSA